MSPPPPSSTLFPYTTLFRSTRRRTGVGQVVRGARGRHVDGARGARHDGARSAVGASGRREHAARSALPRSEEHTSELQSHVNLVCRLLLEKKKNTSTTGQTT